MLFAVFGALGAWFAMMGVPFCLRLLMISAVNPCHWVNPLAILLSQYGGYTLCAYSLFAALLASHATYTPTLTHTSQPASFPFFHWEDG